MESFICVPHSAPTDVWIVLDLHGKEKKKTNVILLRKSNTGEIQQYQVFATGTMCWVIRQEVSFALFYASKIVFPIEGCFRNVGAHWMQALKHQTHR